MLEKNHLYEGIKRINQKYKVKSKFLQLLINGGEYNEDISIDGYTNSGNRGFARFALERLTRYAFNIQRYPGHEDQIVFEKVAGDSFIHFSEWIDFFENKITEDEINEAIEEIINIYNHVQEQLKDRTAITCYRGLQPHECLQIIDKLDFLQPKDSISYRASTIVSFRDKRRLYPERLTIKVKVPVKNILMHHAFIETDKENIHSHDRDGLNIEHELLYLNDSIKGIFTLNREDILNWEEMKEDRRFQDTIKDSKRMSIANNYQFINQNSYHNILFYDQVYWVHLKNYKERLFDQLSPKVRKKVEKDLQYLLEYI